MVFSSSLHVSVRVGFHAFGIKIIVLFLRNRVQSLQRSKSEVFLSIQRTNFVKTEKKTKLLEFTLNEVIFDQYSLIMKKN